MNPKSKLILPVLFLFVQAAQGQFRHQVKLDSVPENGFYSIGIAPSLCSYLATDLSDLRLVDEAMRPVSYIVEDRHRQDAQPRLVKHRLARKESGDSKTIAIVENPKKDKLSHFILELKSAVAVRTGSLSGSDNLVDWYVILDSFHLQGASEASDTSVLRRFNFPLSTYRYFRVSITNEKKGPLNIIAVLSDMDPLTNDASPLFLDNPGGRISVTDSAGYSIIRLVYERPVHAAMFRLGIESPLLFRRKARVLRAVTGDLRDQPGEQVIISSDAYNDYRIGLIKTDTFYLLIENGDNPALRIGTFTTGAPNRRVIAQLEKGKDYYLLMDNPGARKPEYDLDYFRDRIGMARPLGYGAVTRADHPEPVAVTKSGAKRWIWPVIILALGLLILLTWKLISDVNKK